MSFENPGDGKRCDHCNRAGKPYEYKGEMYSGLHKNRGEWLCPSCLTADVAATGVNIHVTDAGGVDYIHNTVRDRNMITVRSPNSLNTLRHC